VYLPILYRDVAKFPGWMAIRFDLYR